MMRGKPCRMRKLCSDSCNAVAACAWSVVTRAKRRITTQCTGALPDAFSHGQSTGQGPVIVGVMRRRGLMQLRDRHPKLYLATMGIAILGHCALSYPATVSRGYPPIDPFWEYVAIYIVFLFPIIPPVFDDFAASPKVRNRILISFAIAAAVTTSVAKTNMMSATPRPGAHAGYFGVWYHGFAMVVINTVLVSLVAVPFVICLESIARSLWGIIRTFPDSRAA